MNYEACQKVGVAALTTVAGNARSHFSFKPINLPQVSFFSFATGLHDFFATYILTRDTLIRTTTACLPTPHTATLQYQ